MRARPAATFLALILFATASPVAAQEWGALRGEVVAEDSGFPIPGVTVVVHGTNFGTASDDEGNYLLRLPVGRFTIRFSAIGFATRLDTVDIASGRTVVRDVTLSPATLELGEVTIEAEQSRQAGVFELSPEDVQNIPAPVRDALRALRVLPGVAANNELSNQFSVRGGGFNENLFFVNGFEIFLPFRPRTGEQEGLSLINPDLARRITLYTGGFPAEYGGKLSSAVDVEYRKPHRTGESFSGSVFASLLDVGGSAGASALDGRLGILTGVRRARARRFFETQELKGEFAPDYTDFQTYVGFTPSPGHEIEFLGMFADHEFRLDPNSRKTFFGTLSQNTDLAPSNLQSLWVRFDDDNEEIDGYSTLFGGLRLSNRLTPGLRVEHEASVFDTEETESLDLSGTAILFQVDPGSDNPQDGEGLFPTGSSRQEDFADNRVAVRTLSGGGSLHLTTDVHAAQAGYTVRRLDFDDRLDEKSVVVGRATTGETVRIVADSLRDTAEFGAWQAGFHAQDAVDVLRDDPGRLLVTGGLRVDYYSFTGEWTVSPRSSFTWKHNPLVQIFGSAGVYHQAPTYRELRGKPEPGETILGALNRDLRSQRSLQFVLGGEYFIPTRRLFVRGEAYLKSISDVISYDIENVRVRYSGENDAGSNTYGVDLQIRGELVPGLESWLNYSYLVADETFKDEFETERNTGGVPRPTDQRHTVSLFVQDYIPNDPTWKLHMRTLYGSGLPYTPPVPGEKVGNLLNQVPGDRHSARYLRFFRFDIGVTKEVGSDRTDAPFSLDLTAEILNLFDMTNTVSYSWVPDQEGIWQRIPTRLTPRTLNVRATVTF